MACCSVFGFNRFIAFSLTFISYAFLHASRKAFGNLKPSLISIWISYESNNSLKPAPSIQWDRGSLFENSAQANTFVGLLDSVFMASYAFGLYVSGWIGDRLDPRLVLSSGMLLTSLTVFLFGVFTEWIHLYSKPFYVIIWIFNGLFQSTCWPSAVAIVCNWFGESRGVIFGLWTACASAGNIFGDLLVGSIVPYGYDYAFAVHSALLISNALIVYSGLIVHPKELKNVDTSAYTPIASEEYEEEIDVDNISDTDLSHTLAAFSRTNEDRVLSFRQVLLLPGVIPYSFAYACLKMVNYAFFFWLPLYLDSNFHLSPSMASEFSAFYDLGAIIGGLVAGFLSDLPFLFLSRSCVNIGFLLFSVPALIAYSTIPASPLSLNAFVLFLTGFFTGGPATVISTVIGADVGTRPELCGSKALATVTGIIDGTGSVGASVGQLLVPVLKNAYGWSSVFHFFIASILVAIIMILPIYVKELINNRVRIRSRLETT